MPIEVMKRYENKYLVSSDTYLKFQDRIAQFTEVDAYNKKIDFYTIANLYYDTEDNNLIRTSIAKPKYKEKLRIRAYGVPGLADKVFLEVKKKFKQVVNKRRTEFALWEAYDFAATGRITPKEYMNNQVLQELKYFIRLHNPVPKLYLAYDRRAYLGEDDLRITFDKNIRTRRYDLKLEQGDYGENLLEDDLCLMEIKVNEAMPLWLTNILTEYQIYSQSFSKYGAEYKKFIALERGDKLCLNQFLMPQTEPLFSPYKVLLPQWQ